MRKRLKKGDRDFKKHRQQTGALKGAKLEFWRL